VRGAPPAANRRRTDPRVGEAITEGPKVPASVPVHAAREEVTVTLFRPANEAQTHGVADASVVRVSQLAVVDQSTQL
jgi:hypothetical protein